MKKQYFFFFFLSHGMLSFSMDVKEAILKRKFLEKYNDLRTSSLTATISEEDVVVTIDQEFWNVRVWVHDRSKIITTVLATGEFPNNIEEVEIGEFIYLTGTVL